MLIKQIYILIKTKQELSTKNKKGEEMRHDYIAIFEFIERGFSKNEKCFCYDLLRDKKQPVNISEFGVK